MAKATFSGTVDADEIEKFSKLAEQWWAPEGEFRALHRMNPARLSFIRDCVGRVLRRGGRRPLEGVRALDIGCGGGLVSEPLARMGAVLTGIDGSEAAISAARAHAAAGGLSIDYRVSTAEVLADAGETFELVTALEILEHVADVAAFLAAASALVAPGGLLIVSTINRTQQAKVLAIDMAEKVLRWAPEGAHDHDKLVTPDEIRAGAPGLVWEAPVGISFKPLGSGWELSSDISMNYLMAGRKPG